MIPWYFLRGFERRDLDVMLDARARGLVTACHRAKAHPDFVYASVRPGDMAVAVDGNSDGWERNFEAEQYGSRKECWRRRVKC